MTWRSRVILAPSLKEMVRVPFEGTGRLFHEPIQNCLAIVYGERQLRAAFRLDMVVENAVIVELKSVAKLHPIHEAQMLSYLKLSGLKLGLIINFNVVHLRDGVKRMVNRL